MKTTFISTAFAAIMCATGAETVNDWENPAVNSINRLPARSYSMPLADEQAAFTDAIEPETPWKISLNGKWRISWTGDPRLRVKDFWKQGYDDSDWFEIDVPSCVELKGFGSPGYTNSQYPHARKWPRILDVDTLEPDYNPVTGYRRTFRIPDGWKDRNVILRFDGVYSAYYVWVNGRKVGYAEDSKLPSEFDITSFLNASGDQTLCVEVYRWCDGSYLEDQDMIRYSGIFRDVTVWSRPADGIWDFTVKTKLSDGYRAATVSLEGLDGAWSAVLYDAARNPVARLSPSAVSARLEGVRLWSAEDPYLYTLIVKKGDDIRMRRVGFKEQKISGNTLLVNGRKIKFKGVNRHECSVENGRTVSLDEMLQDITLMKRYNIDTVRTSHYPNHRLWYDLCDRYGIYLIAEANVEAHGYGYKEEGLGNIPAWNHSIVERNVRHAVFYRNHPSVTMWSMGNESGHGDCFRNAIAAVKKADPSRPVHWERGNADADIDSSMYPSVEWLEKRGKLGNEAAGGLSGEAGGGGYAISGHTAGKPYIACEYAHAMGNAIGNFREYWDVMYSYDCLLGGCIWDWVDQSVWMGTGHVDPATGREERFLAYGGDWDEEPHLGPFCNNGVTDPFRNVTAKLVEVAHVHRNLVVTRKDDGALELWNRHGFTRADAFDGSWELVEDGTAVASGNFAVPPVAPLSRGKLDLPLPAYGFREGCEYFLNVSFKTKSDALWAKKGWTVARDQIPVHGTPAWVRFCGKTDSQGVSVDTSGDCVTVSAGPTKAVFSRKTGTLCELTMDGRTILKDPAESVVSGPLLTCARAFTDNDRWVRDGSPWGENRKIGGFFSRGLSRLRHHARPLAVNGATVTSRMEVTGSKSAGFIHEQVWSFSADGSAVVSNTVIPYGTMPPALPRLGLSMRLDAGLERMAYYGRGPRENYIDRNSGSFVGLWRSTVADQYEPYVRPQENGGKSDVRWVEFTDGSGKGVRFSASEPLFVKASHHDWEDLDFARHRAGQKRYRSLPPDRKEIYLDLDIRQLGLGGASCGPKPMKKYTFPIRKETWTLRFEPAKTVPRVSAPVRAVQPPPYPGKESWGFRKDLAMPEALRPVPTNDVRFVRGKVAGYESYRIDVADDGKVTVTTEDDEGLRRAVYYYQDRVRAGDLKSCVRKPWVKNRISRCFFGPIKRPPLNHDELMDDVDYYPEAYLDRLAHEGINGLWLTIEWRDIAETSFTKRSPDADRRLAKLRRTVDRCLKYGIKTWIFCIEPKMLPANDPLYRENPDMFGVKMWNGCHLMCTATPKAQRYIEESVRDNCSRVPRLGGIMMIAHGERPTTCLSTVDVVTGNRGAHACKRCLGIEPWQIYRNTTDAIVRGIRAAGSNAEYISWFYQPQVQPERAPWVAECARHVPEGVTFAYNFESGAVKNQLGRMRTGGDYWLSFVGPAGGFNAVADAGRLAGCSIGAKIQVGNSHEVATVPFVPVPGLLYRKYKSMREAGVSTVLQCWYFGNYPGIMNKAAGELSFDDFSDDEDAFLRKLAAPYWGEDAALMASVWKRFSDAYAEYPLSNDMQYYGPFHAGPAWPLYADVKLAPLGRTWKPQDPPSGDTIGEALENHTIEEAVLLGSRMAEGVRMPDADGRDVLDSLAERWKHDPERVKDIAVMKALEYQFMSGGNILRFYAERARALYESRVRGNPSAALDSLATMDRIVSEEEKLTAKLLPLAKADSRLGFHSEAEAHQYHPAKLEWRLGELKETHARISAIASAVRAGDAYPESEFEKNAPSCRAGGEWTVMKDGNRFRVKDESNGDMTVEVEFKSSGSLMMSTIDAAGVSWYRSVTVCSNGKVTPAPSLNRISPDHEISSVSTVKSGSGVTVKFTLSAYGWGGNTARRPGWILFSKKHESVWPLSAREHVEKYRLNLGALYADNFGRILR